MRRSVAASLAVAAVVAAALGLALRPRPPGATDRPVLPPPPPRAVTAIALARTTPTSLALAPTVRPDGADAPDTFAVPGPFVAQRGGGAAAVFAAPLPVSADLFPSRRVGARTFGFYAPDGLEVQVNGTPLRFTRNATRPGTWGYTHDALLIGLAPGSSPPEDVRVRWPEATAQERSLHAITADRTPEAFALRTLVRDDTSAHGVLLPAPSDARWRVTIPERAVLAAHARLVPPTIRTAARSDGATLVVRVTAAGDAPSREVARVDLSPDTPEDLRVDLGAFAGQTVDLSLHTLPGETPTHDLVFIEEPVVYTPTDAPQRVVLAFLDTVRADHLGMYGYARPTTPILDAWAAGAAVMTQARSVSPWTLPAARSILSGHQPEAFYDVTTLPAALAQAGFHTEGIVANAYLGPVFDMDRGFSRYTYRHLQTARDTVDQALEVFDRFPDRDVMVLVQFMEAHLPYQEPASYRGLFEGDAPDGLRLLRQELDRWSPDRPGFEAVRDHVVGRYDQNLRVLDDEVGRLLASLSERDIAVVFSDHGEEFWEHGGFEHGHAFWDEVLRVPLIVRAPSLPPSRIDAPTSLLDIAPTVRAALGIPADPTAPGRDLGPASRGEAGATDALAARPQAFGRALYGGPGWAVLDRGLKWLARDGAEAVWDLAADPGETRDIGATTDRTGFPAAGAEALGRAFPAVWRISLSARPQATPVTLTLTHPDGLVTGWKAHDPRGYFDATTVTAGGGAVTITVPRGERAPPVLFVQPAGSAANTRGLTLTIDGGVAAGTLAVETDTPPAPDGARQLVLGPVGPWRVAIDHAYAALPGGVAVRGYAPSAAAALEALGYLSDDDEDSP